MHTITASELKRTSGGFGKWKQYSNGTYENFGTYIVYTVAAGDVLKGVALRFGVTAEQICRWNNLQTTDLIYPGQKLTLYPTILR
jgi:hypothetical protein